MKTISHSMDRIIQGCFALKNKHFIYTKKRFSIYICLGSRSFAETLLLNFVHG